MLSHWYNHDNVGNSLKVNNKSMNSMNKYDSQNFLKVPNPNNVSSGLMLPTQCTASTTSINSKGSATNMRDGSPNSRMPWKIVLLGDAGVGKTSLVKQFLNRCFSPLYNPTVEDSYWHNINLPDGLNQCLEILDTSGFYQFPAMKELNVKMGTAFLLVFDLTKEESLQSLIELRQYIINTKGTENIPIVLVGNKSDAVVAPAAAVVVPANGGGVGAPAVAELSAATSNNAISASSASTPSTPPPAFLPPLPPPPAPAPAPAPSSSVSEKAETLATETFKCKYIETSAKNNVNVTKMFNMIVELILKELEEIRESASSQSLNVTNRRNSSISFVRRISVGACGKINEQSRRYSEPVVGENGPVMSQASKKSKKGASSQSGKDSLKDSSTPTSSARRKQKYCTIS